MFKTTRAILAQHGIEFNDDMRFSASHASDQYTAVLAREADFILDEKLHDEVSQLKLANFILSIYEYNNEK